jgi:colicin import membrane protein
MAQRPRYSLVWKLVFHPKQAGAALRITRDEWGPVTKFGSAAATTTATSADTAADTAATAGAGSSSTASTTSATAAAAAATSAASVTAVNTSPAIEAQTDTAAAAVSSKAAAAAAAAVDDIQVVASISDTPPLAVPCMLQSGALAIQPAGHKGLGAFAATAIAAGTWLGEYSGELLSQQQLDARYDSGSIRTEYVFEAGVGREMYIDARDPQLSSWHRFVNHAAAGPECNVEVVCHPAGELNRHYSTLQKCYAYSMLKHACAELVLMYIYSSRRACGQRNANDLDRCLQCRSLLYLCTSSVPTTLPVVAADDGEYSCLSKRLLHILMLCFINNLMYSP